MLDENELRKMYDMKKQIFNIKINMSNKDNQTVSSIYQCVDLFISCSNVISSKNVRFFLSLTLVVEITFDLDKL